MELFFTFGHRRSCSILQRDSIEDTDITERMSTLLDEEIDDASSDFDKIKQEGCEYGKERVNIDVDRILGLKGSSEVQYQNPEQCKKNQFE